MYEGCSYHIIDSLLPPSAEENQFIKDSFLRLENICARAIVYQNYDGTPMTRTRTKIHENTLSNLHPLLHNVLWNTYLLHKYYTSDFACTFDEVSQLLLYWPNEEFDLKKLMPRLPPKLEIFTSVPQYQNDDRGPDVYFVNLDHIDRFRKDIIWEIIDFYVKFHNNSFSEQRKKVLKVRRINITGFATNFSDLIRMIKVVKNKELACKNNKGRLEIVLDAVMYIDETFKENGDAFKLFSSSLSSSLIKVNHVSVNTFLSMGANILIKLIKIIVNNGKISINMNYDYDNNNSNNSRLLNQIYDKKTWGSNVLSVQLEKCASFMNFLDYLNNIVHLTLRFNNLHGKLRCLTKMSRGLLYLNLCGCKLTNTDLYHLKGSCHVLTLKELNLNANNFSYDDDSKNLIDLCQSLPNVVNLGLALCRLETWPNNSMSLLFDSMKNIPNALDIMLFENAFSLKQLNEHIIKLKESISLRKLHIALPPGVPESGKKIFSDSINKEMNMLRSQFLQVEVYSDVYD